MAHFVLGDLCRHRCYPDRFTFQPERHCPISRSVTHKPSNALGNVELGNCAALHLRLGCVLAPICPTHTRFYLGNSLLSQASKFLDVEDRYPFAVVCSFSDDCLWLDNGLDCVASAVIAGRDLDFGRVLEFTIQTDRRCLCSGERTDYYTKWLGIG